MKNRIIDQGTTFLITTGEYDDYKIVMLCKALDKLDVEVLQEEYLTQFPGQREDLDFSEFRFAAWLIDQRYAKEIVHVEFWLGYCEPNFQVVDL